MLFIISLKSPREPKHVLCEYLIVFKIRGVSKLHKFLSRAGLSSLFLFVVMALCGVSPLSIAADPNLKDHPRGETEAGFCVDCEAEKDNSSDPGDLCKKLRLGAICKLGIFKPKADPSKAIRTAQERLEYFRDYQNCKVPDAYKGFKLRYRTYVDSAAKATGLPNFFLECLMFQESQWHSKNKSHTGALGLGQFTEDAAKVVDGLISSAKSPAAARAEIKSDGVKLAKAQSVKNKSSQTLKDISYLQQRILSRKLYLDWVQYFESIKPLEVELKGKMVRPWTGPAPRDFSKGQRGQGSDAEKAVHSIGAVAILTRFNMNLMNRVPTIPTIKNDDDLVDFFAVLGGFHNRGAGKLAERLGSPAPGTYAGWIKKLGGSGGKPDWEARKHMENLKRCMRKNGGAPLYGREKLAEQNKSGCRDTNK